MKFSIFNFQFSRNIIYILLFLFVVLGLVKIVLAANPTGNNWFQLLTDHQTGGDNTGDGGTGNSADFNYYYVGQSFTTNIQIRSLDGTNASNIWIDYDSALLSASNLQTGTFFPNWSNQTISGGRIKSTGYRTSLYSTSTGSFGSVRFMALRPTEANYSLSSPGSLVINVGIIGDSTESNIAKDGVDLLNSAENFNYHIWADTKQPYAKNSSPTNSSSGVSVDSNYSFDLRDSKNGEGDDSGVGTGVNTSTGLITFNDGGGAVNYNSSTNFSCSGTWGTNLCNTVVNPVSPSGIIGDQRNWKYNTDYTVNVSGFADFASSNQNQLPGDSNGPNTMNTKTWSFTTENDIIAPRLFNESPARGSSGNSVNPGISFEIQDRKIYPGSISGAGVNSATCKLHIASLTFPSTTLQQGDAGVSVQAIDYGYRFNIIPNTSFGQNETISVSVYDCADLAGNIMATDNYTFLTLDNDAPYIDGISPANDSSINANGSLSFHIKDDGVGVDLDNTVIYVNGIYYTKNGGAGIVTNTGTTIAFNSSLSFMGGNYLGDTTAVTGNSSDYGFLINPENDFNSGEAVPVIVYTRDLSGNLMARYVYALVVAGGGSCNGGQSYCGSGTSWNGAVCVGTIGGGGPVYSPQPFSYCGTNTVWDNTNSKCIGSFFGSGYCGEGTVWNGTQCIPSADNQPALIYNPSVTQIDDKSVLVTWSTTIKGSSKVIFDTKTHSDSDVNYYYSTSEVNESVFYHSVLIDGLTSGTLYYFRPVSKIKNEDIYGEELKMAPRYFSEVKEITNPIIKNVPVETAVPGTCPTTGGETATTVPGIQLQIGNITLEGGDIVFRGYAKPSSKIKITIHPDESNADLKNIDIQTDVNGYWEYHTNSGDFGMGSYQIDVIDESGNKQTKSLVVLQKATGQATGLQAPNFFSRGNAANLIYITLFLAVMVLPVVNLYYLIKKAKGQLSNKAIRQLSKKPKKQLNMTAKPLLFIIVILVIVVLSAVLAFRNYNKLKAPSLINISGSLINPLNNQGFGGVDLSSGNVSIKTSNSGAYNFGQIKSDEGIKITYPTLLRSLVETTDSSGNKNMYFNPDMDNVLIRVIDLESRNQFDKVYQYLYPAAKQKITLDQFTQDYTSIFSSADISNQTINIGKTEIIAGWNNKKYDFLIPQVVAINVINRNQNETFYLVFDNNQWWIVK